MIRRGGKRNLFFGSCSSKDTMGERLHSVEPSSSGFYNRTFNTTTEMLICPGWETLVVPVSQPGTPGRDKRGGPFVPGLATGTKGYLLSRLVTPTGTKGAASATWPTGTKCPFFPVFLFSILFLFQLYFCISIILMYWNSVCMISTNIYIYI